MNGGGDPAQVLADLPVQLWGALLRAVRRAADRLAPAELPGVLRPFARWTPDALAAERPRRAVAEALAADPRLREAVGEALGSPAAFQDAAEADVARLAAAHGAELAAAALAARGRWQDLATVAAATAQQVAARERTGAEADLQREAAEAQAARRRIADELAAAREERDAQRRRADAAEQRLASVSGDRDQLRERLAELAAQVARLGDQLDEERRRSRERLARQRRRVQEAQAAARVDNARAMRVAAGLEALAADLRAALQAEQDETDSDPPGPPPDAPAVPRDVAPSQPGRPSVLPAGLSENDPLAVRSLLQVEGLQVVLDGYNVSMDERGQAQASLGDQRRWLLRVAAGVVARYRRRVTVVFDGTDPRSGELSAPRGVRVLFTVGGQSADERISRLVEGLGPQTPVLVVSSDRQVRADCAALGANVTASSSFLVAVGA